MQRRETVNFEGLEVKGQVTRGQRLTWRPGGGVVPASSCFPSLTIDRHNAALRLELIDISRSATQIRRHVVCPSYNILASDDVETNLKLPRDCGAFFTMLSFYNERASNSNIP